MKKVLIRASGFALAIVLTVFACLTGCAKKTSDDVIGAPDQNSDEKTNVAMGRYVEESLELPHGDLAPVLKVESDGSLVLYNVVDGSIVRYASADGKKWEETDAGPLGALPSMSKGFGDFTSLSQVGDTLYVLYRDHDYKPHLVKSEKGAALSEIPIEDWIAPASKNASDPPPQVAGDIDTEPKSSKEPATTAEQSSKPHLVESEKGAAPSEIPIEDLIAPASKNASDPPPQVAGDIDTEPKSSKEPAATAEQSSKETQNTPKKTAEPEDNMDVVDLSSTLLFPQAMAALPDGDVLIGYFNQIIRYDSNGKKKQSLEGNGSGFVPSGNKLLTLSKDRSALVTINLESGSVENTVPLPSVSTQTDNVSYSTAEESTMVVGDDGALYIVDHNGVHRLAKGGSLWETVVDGSLNSMCIPSMNIASLLLDKKDGFYVTLLDDKGAHLMHYTYSANTPAVPSTELSVYALNDNGTVRQAIGEFQRNNPDVKVTFRYGLSEGDAATQADAVRTLNAELLAGKGPDILLLDGLPAQSYVEKGVLEDLAQPLGDLLQSKALLQNIVDCYTHDGKLYTLPVRVAFPIMIGKKDAVERAKTLHSLAEAVSAGDGKKYLAANTPAGRIAEFYLTSAPAFRNADGTLDVAKLTEFLADVKTISDGCDSDSAQTDSSITISVVKPGKDGLTPDELGYTDGGFASLIALNKGQIQLQMQMLGGFSHYALPVSVKNKLGDCAITCMGGQSENVFVPHGLVAINAASKQKELAISFVKSLFGDSVQSANLGDGFPINESVIKKTIEESSKTQYMISVGVSGGDEVLTATTPSAEETKLCADLLRSLKTPSTVDSVLLEMIQHECDAFFAGEKTAEQTASAIAERTQAYLAE